VAGAQRHATSTRGGGKGGGIGFLQKSLFSAFELPPRNAIKQNEIEGEGKHILDFFVG
jgi:hypothetical protein